MENTLKIFYPFKPYKITQHWGNVPIDPNTGKSKYLPLGFEEHNGVDANTGKLNWDGTVMTEFPVYCPVEGFTVQRVDYAPNGGGNELWLISDMPMKIGDRTCYAYIPLCHAKKILVKEGDKPSLGELLMIGDNTGFSTGLHTHMGLYRIEYTGTTIHFLDQNDSNGSFNPELFFAKQYAIDQASFSTLIKSSWKYYQYVLTN